MFGKHARLERELRQHGRAAFATVLSARVRMPALTARAQINMGWVREKRGPTLWKMTVRVEPDDGPPFDAKVFDWLNDRPLRVVGVLYDPSDHRKVIIDRSDEARRSAEQEAILRGQMLSPQASQAVSAPASDPDPLDQLAKLADLHERGALTDAEFEAQKHKLLGQ